jgi:transposase-like protein
LTTKLLEVVICDICPKDRPAVAHVEIDVCKRHDEMLSERAAESGYVCDECGRVFTTPGGLAHHQTVKH